MAAEAFYLRARVRDVLIRDGTGPDDPMRTVQVSPPTRFTRLDPSRFENDAFVLLVPEEVALPEIAAVLGVSAKASAKTVHERLDAVYAKLEAERRRRKFGEPQAAEAAEAAGQGNSQEGDSE